MKTKNIVILIIAGVVLGLFSCKTGEESTREDTKALHPLKVSLKDSSLLGQRLENNQKVSLWHNLNMLEERGYFENFRLAAGLTEGEYRGNRHGYADSEVYKFIEGASYIYERTLDTKIIEAMDSIIFMISLAQKPNGHLQTRDAVRGIDTIYADNAWMNHRMYNAGHLYEGAVAHHKATGKNNLLSIALKNAEMMCGIINDSTRKLVTSGHPEIETGLMKLYKHTGNREHFIAARKLIDLRGSENDTGQGLYDQKYKPVLSQTEAVGHAVRAVYLYMGITDLAHETGEPEYVQMLDSVWNNMTSRKTYITGGIGSFHRIMENGELRGWEGFGDNYELPDDCYCESCAAIANVLWNQRMFLLHKEAKYVDAMEKVIYNNGLSMASKEGNRFFYENEISASAGNFPHRKGWVGCCTNNILRYYPQLPGFFYAYGGKEIYINLYSASSAEFDINGNTVKIIQETDYPWDGKVNVIVKTEDPTDIDLYLRIPGWLKQDLNTGGLYKYMVGRLSKPVCLINGEKTAIEETGGYIRLSRDFHDNDEILIDFPMQVSRVIAHEKVINLKDRVAFQRGPVVFCAESHENELNLKEVIIPQESVFTFNRSESNSFLKYSLLGEGLDESGNSKRMQLIPYYLWANRGSADMEVWFKGI